MSTTGREIEFTPIKNGWQGTKTGGKRERLYPYPSSDFERTPKTDEFKSSSKSIKQRTFDEYSDRYNKRQKAKLQRQRQIAARTFAALLVTSVLGGSITAANSSFRHNKPDSIATMEAANDNLNVKTDIIDDENNTNIDDELVAYEHTKDVDSSEKEDNTSDSAAMDSSDKTNDINGTDTDKAGTTKVIVEYTDDAKTLDEKSSVNYSTAVDSADEAADIDKTDDNLDIDKPKADIETQSVNKAQIDRLNEIFEADPNAKRAFDDIEIALKRASFEFKENAVDVLKEIQEKYAPHLPLITLMCVMEQEGGGYARDWDNGKYKVGPNQDAGPFQITPICEEEVNTTMNTPEINEKLGSKRDGEIFDRFNIFDNAKIAAVKLACDYEYFNGDIRKTLFAYNAGRYPAEKSDNNDPMGPYVGSTYAAHIAYFENNPEMLEYILAQDYSKPSPKDGIDHVLINDYTGKALYDYKNMSYNPNATYTPYPGLNVGSEIH